MFGNVYTYVFQVLLLLLFDAPAQGSVSYRQYRGQSTTYMRCAQKQHCWLDMVALAWPNSEKETLGAFFEVDTNSHVL